MKKLVTTVSAFALTAILATGIAYAVESGDTPEGATLTIVSSIPAENAAIPGLFDDDVISVTIAQASEYPEMYVEYEIEGKQTGTWEGLKGMVWMNRYEDTSEYLQTIVGSYPMYEGVEYRIKINAWESESMAHGVNRLDNRLGYAYINLTGTSEMYENSPYTLTSITPEGSGDDPYSENGLLSDETPYITVTFDGPVNLGNSSDTGILLGSGAGKEAFDSLEAVGETETVNGKEYAKEWHLVFRDGYIASQTSPIIISMKATDDKGRVLKGNMGEFAGSYSLYYYNVPGMYGDIDFDFGTAPIASVSNITASFAMGINFAWMYPYSDATVTHNGEVVATVTNIKQIFPADTDPDDYQAQASGANMILDKTITEPGTYELNLPGGYFALGTEFTVRYQKAESIEFTVGTASTPDDDVDPVSGATLDIVSSIPAENAALPGLFNDDLVSVTIAQASEYPEMYVEYEIQGNETGKWETLKGMVWMNRDGNTDVFTQTIAGNYEMYEGVDYRIKINAWEAEYMAQGPSRMDNRLGYGYINLKGTSAMYESSPYTLVSINPKESGESVYGNVLPDDTPYLTVTFDGPVNLGDYTNTGILIGMGAGNEAFASIEAAGESETVNGKEYAKAWNLVFPEGYIAMQTSPMMITIKATDAEGRVVKGNTGEKAGSYSLFSYNVPGMYGEIEFDFGAEPCASVKEIIGYFNENDYLKGISYSYLVPMSDAKVLLNGTEVAKVIDVVQVYAPEEEDVEDAVAIGARMILDKAVNTPGVYTLSLPDGYFNLGTQFFVRYQKATEVEFTVSKGVEFNVLPAEGKVSQLDTFDIQYEVDGELEISETADRPYLYIASEGINSSKWSEISVMGNTLSLKLTAPITDPDNYTLVVPAGFLTVDGTAVPNISVEYVIEQNNTPGEDYPAVFTPASGAVTELPAQIDFVFPDWEEDGWALGSGKATIQYNDEAPVALSEATFDWDAPLNEGWQSLDGFAGKTEEGTYTIKFPEGYFQLGYNGDVAPEMIVVYTIGNVTPAYPAEFSPAPGTVTELPAQIDFVFPGWEEDGWALGSGKATIQYNDEAPVALSEATFDWDAPLNEGWQPLDEFGGKTEAGKYTITFPEGYFQLGYNGDVAPEMILVYTIEGGSVEPQLPATFDPAPGSKLKALPESIFFDFGEEYICYGEYSETVATIQKDNEAPVELPEIEYSYDWPKGQGYQELGEFANSTEKGTYVIYFPYDYFRLGHWSANVDETTTPVEAMTITYTVDDGTGVNVVSIKSDRYRVYNTNGVMVLDTTNADDLKALKGLYIVNGIKIVLK